VRFVYVVVLENVRGSQTRQKSDERQRHSDERQFTYAQVEEQQHVFKRVVRRFVGGLYGGLGGHVSRAGASTPPLRSTARSSTTPVEQKHPRYTVYPNDNKIRYDDVGGRTANTKTRYFFSTSTAGDFERRSGRPVSPADKSRSGHHHVCYLNWARSSFALYIT